MVKKLLLILIVLLIIAGWMLGNYYQTKKDVRALEDAALTAVDEFAEEFYGYFNLHEHEKIYALLDPAYAATIPFEEFQAKMEHEIYEPCGRTAERYINMYSVHIDKKQVDEVWIQYYLVREVADTLDELVLVNRQGEWRILNYTSKKYCPYPDIIMKVNKQNGQVIIMRGDTEIARQRIDQSGSFIHIRGSVPDGKVVCSEGGRYTTYEYKDNLPDGKCEVMSTTNRQKRASVTFVHGVQDGPFAYYYPHGQVERVGTYKNGMLDGVMKIYYDTENQKRRTFDPSRQYEPEELAKYIGEYIEVLYDEGVVEDRKVFVRHGDDTILFLHDLYRNGVVVRRDTYSSEGFLFKRASIKNNRITRLTVFYPSGVRRAYMRWENNILVEDKEWNEAGQLMADRGSEEELVKEGKVGSTASQNAQDAYE